MHPRRTREHAPDLFPPGAHPFLRVDGEPIFLHFDPDREAPESDRSNFCLDGKLGRVLRSTSFARFMEPRYESPEAGGRTLEEVWWWAAGQLDLHPWRRQSPGDLGWLEERLHGLDFLVQRRTGLEVRWFYVGF